MKHFHSLKRRAACGIKQAGTFFNHTIFLLPGSRLGFIWVLFVCLFVCFHENVHGEMSVPLKLFFYIVNANNFSKNSALYMLHNKYEKFLMKLIQLKSQSEGIPVNCNVKD